MVYFRQYVRITTDAHYSFKSIEQIIKMTIIKLNSGETFIKNEQFSITFIGKEKQLQQKSDI